MVQAAAMSVGRRRLPSMTDTSSEPEQARDAFLAAMEKAEAVIDAATAEISGGFKVRIVEGQAHHPFGARRPCVPHLPPTTTVILTGI